MLNATCVVQLLDFSGCATARFGRLPPHDAARLELLTCRQRDVAAGLVRDRSAIRGVATPRHKRSLHQAATFPSVFVVGGVGRAHLLLLQLELL